MKKIFEWMTIYFWGLTTGVPLIYSMLMGKFPRIYQVMSDSPDKYMILAAKIMTIFTISVLVLVHLTPIGKKKFVPGLDIGSWYYYTVMILYILSFMLKSGGDITQLRNIRNSATGATIGSILGIFYDAWVLFLLFVLHKKGNFNLILASIIFLFYTILLASRSGIIFIGVILICYVEISDKTDKNRKRIKSFFVFLAIISPLVFVISTDNRGGMKAGENVEEVAELIAGRCSNLELDGIMLYQSDTKRWQEDIFWEKYGIVNQMKLAINSMVPGDIYETDVNPNQYYRVIAGYLSSEDAAKYYTSLCMTLPTYCILKNGFIMGMMLAVGIVWLFYFLCAKCPSTMAGCCLAITVYQNLVIYFDWVMFVNSIKNMFFTIFALYCIQTVFGNCGIRNRKKLKPFRIRY